MRSDVVGDGVVAGLWVWVGGVVVEVAEVAEVGVVEAVVVGVVGLGRLVGARPCPSAWRLGRSRRQRR